jgi:thioredoxin-like negative regulator of GroEL
MEEAIAHTINSTVATFVDKAVTGAMEHAFKEAVDKAIQEKEQALEERIKAMEELVKVVEENFNVIEEKAEVTIEELRVTKEKVKAYEEAFDAAVEEVVKERVDVMQKKINRRCNATVLKAKIKTVCFASPRINRDTDAQGIRHKGPIASEWRQSCGT